MTLARRIVWLWSLVPLLAVGEASAVQLAPFLGGLSAPLYMTHARDGTGRLFVVEQRGVIKVLAPGAATPSVFLDITDRVLCCGEQGLLGLAFHPQYPVNGRFFLNYTRRPDGATVIAEYRRSADANVALRDEIGLLTIGQPFANHNAGMVEFGYDGLLYVGTGDGGSGNDPQNHAQTPGDLLGKMLRLDVDQPGSAPEIFAVGLRNPFRFSFDRVTGQLYVGDVGQGQWEEIDIVAGGNYGWRVFEGTHCTGNDPGRCSETGFIGPVAEYFHSAGRCSVTGGYVYRGTRGTLPTGTYVFGDFCTGEIFALNGNAPTLLLDTTLAISSFAEDEAGELYVVDLTGGAVHRLVTGGEIAIAAAVLPGSRSVTLGTPATAFATIVTAGEVAARGCRLLLPAPLPVEFVFQTTDPATNAVTGAANTPVDIPPHSSQSFVFALTPRAAVDPAVVEIGFACENGAAAPVFAGVNTFQFSAAATAVPDVIAVAAFAPGSGGIVDIPGATGTGFFAVASTNVGAGGSLSVAAEHEPALPVTTSICPTDALGQCLSTPAASLTLDIPAGSTPSFAVFVTGGGAVAFDPASHRVFVRFRDTTGAIRGATSAAVRTL